MSLSTSLERLVQTVGAEISYRLFTDAVLARPAGQRGYLFLYELFKRTFESAELDAMSRRIPAGSTVIDVGANVGFTSVVFSRKVGPDGVVVAIEPDPVNGQLLERNLSRNGCDNVRIRSVALGDYDGETTLYRNLANRSDSRVVLDRRTLARSKKVDVPVRTLTSVMAAEPALPDVSLVKVDSQGYEVPILRGMTAWLSSVAAKPVLALECWPYGLDKAGSTPDELFELLDGLGYDVPLELAERLRRQSGLGNYENAIVTPR